MVSELNKRLDLDLDEILLSPKLTLKLSPAELDKSLLDLYDKISESPSGDILRVIGGGGQIGLQNLYLRRKALKDRGRSGSDLIVPELFAVNDWMEPKNHDRSPTHWVRLALQRNLPARKQSSNSSKARKKTSTTRDTPRMSVSTECSMIPQKTARSLTRSSFCQRSSGFSLLI